MNQFLELAVENTVEINEQLAIEALEAVYELDQINTDADAYINVLENISTEDNEKTMNVYAMHLSAPVESINALALEAKDEDGRLTKMKNAVLAFFKSIGDWFKKHWNKVEKLSLGDIDDSIDLIEGLLLRKDLLPEHARNVIDEIKKPKESDVKKLFNDKKKIDTVLDAIYYNRILLGILTFLKNSTAQAHRIAVVSHNKYVFFTDNVTEHSITFETRDIGFDDIDIKYEDIPDVWEILKDQFIDYDIDELITKLTKELENATDKNEIAYIKDNLKKNTMIKKSLVSITKIFKDIAINYNKIVKTFENK